MSCIVRIATPTDAQGILALMEESIRTTLQGTEVVVAETIENVNSNVDYWLANPTECVHLVAESGNRIVGVVLVKDFWNLCSLFVEITQQRAGIGRALTLAAMQECKGHCPKAAIHLNSSPGAIAFYERMGFAPRESNQSLPFGFKAMSLPL